MLSRRSSFVPRRRYLVFGFLMLLSWCLFTLPHLWYAHHGARAPSDGPRQRQIKQDSVVTSHGTTNSSSPAISEAHNLPTHAGPAVTAQSAKHAKETRGNSDVLIVDHEDSRTDDVPIKVNNNNEFDNERTNRNDDVRIQNSGNAAQAMENNGFARDENISSEGRGNDVVANSGQDVPTNSRNVIPVTGNSGLDLVSGDKNRKDFPNNKNARSDFIYTGYSKSKSLDHVNNGEEAYNQKTYENDLVNKENYRGESVPNSKKEHVSNRIIESGDARDGNNGHEFADDGKHGDSVVGNKSKDDDFVNHDVHGNTAFIDRENNRNIAVVRNEDDKDKILHDRDNSGEDMLQAGSNIKDDLLRKENGGYEVPLDDKNSAKISVRNGNSRNDVIVMDADDKNAVFDDKNNMFQVLRHHQDHNVLNGKAEDGHSDQSDKENHTNDEHSDQSDKENHTNDEHSDQSDKENHTNDGHVYTYRLGNEFSSNHEHNRQDALARGREDLVASNGESRSIAGDPREPAQSHGKLNVSLPGISRKGYNISVYDEVLRKFVPFSSSDSTQHTRNNWFPNKRKAADNYPVVQNYNEDNSRGGYGIMSNITDPDQRDSDHNSRGGYGIMSNITNRDQHDSDHNRAIPKGLILKSFREISLDPNYDEDERQEYVPGYKEKPAPGDTQIQVNGTERFPWRPFKAEGVDCSKLFAGDESELRLAQDIQPPAYNTTDLIRDASSCSDFVAQNGFITSPLTSMERDFPIAYSVLVYKDPAQVADLLRAIYRPQNYYCLHVDSHTRRVDQDAFRAIAKCFTNVFLSSRSARVMWGQFGVLQAEVFCMEDLYQYPDWRYFINLTGQEFPLKTNYEIVKILQALRGANDVLVQDTWKFMERWCRYLPAPHNLTIYKGSVHIAVSRPFVHYVLTSPVANDFLHWIRPIKIPDEVFFNTLNHNPHLGVPGSYKGPYVWRNFTHKPHISRFKNWDHTKQWRCAGRKYVRKICILSAGDLPLLDGRPELFANKFFYAYSHVARQCLTEKLYNRTRQETLGTLSFDVTYYKNLPFLRHIVRGSEP